MKQEHRHALPAGTQLDGYRIGDILGAGGFGITYKAVELEIGREVAIKEYLPSGIAGRDPGDATVRPLSAADSEDFEFGLGRFRDEAKTLVSFDHPNIVAVHRFFPANGTAYLVMQYVEGKSLRDILKRAKTLPQHEIEEILHPLLDGLQEVHRAGFLHRDIKPGNIYVRADARPVLIDFGAARLALGGKSKSLTSIVTAGYAPFEQYQSRGNQGVWTDIYAMGAVLYRCVTGERPPDAPDRLPRDTLVPASQAAKGRYGPTFLAAIDAALAVDETRRPSSVAEWRAVFGGGELGPTVPEPGGAKPVDVARPPNPWPRRAAAAAVLLALVGGGYFGWTEYQKGRAGEPITRAQPMPKQPVVAAKSRPKEAAKPVGPEPGTPIQDCALCPQLVVIPAGVFVMGSPTNEPGRKKSEGPRHRVTIAKKLAVGRFEVTLAEWDACAAGGGCNAHRPGDQGWGRGARPAINVSWRDAQAYVRWLSTKTGKRYRLPSEAEWEYAARAGTNGPRYWAGKPKEVRANCRGCGSQWDYKSTAPVGRFAANAFGLYDMLGNVWEWVADCWTDTYDGRLAGQATPRGADKACKHRVSRGGSYLSPPAALRAAHRSGDVPGARDFATGFRVLREVE